MVGRKKTREVATIGPLLDGYQSVDGNDSGDERNEDKTKSLPRPPRKSARMAAMAKSNDGPSYFDVLSDELVVHIFHMFTGGADWQLYYDTWSEGEARGYKVYQWHRFIVHMHSYACY